MFGPKKNTDFRDEMEDMEDVSVSSPRSEALPSVPRVGLVPPRRLADVGKRPAAAPGEEKRLIVGKGLSLKGEIVSCDILVVAGKVEVTLTDGRLLEIQETGQFKGNVEIENADIAGRYDGDLVVHGRLTIRSTGRVGGRVKYGELEVNVGGQIIGELEVSNGAVSPKSGPASSFKNVAGFSISEDDKSKN